MKYLFFLKFVFVDIGNGMLFLCVLIVFSYIEFFLYCLKVFKEMQEDIYDIVFFFVVCCSGLLDLFDMFLKDRVEIFLIK